jgi:hypothetical protein
MQRAMTGSFSVGGPGEKPDQLEGDRSSSNNTM